MVDVNGFSEEAFSTACADIAFRSELAKVCIDWARRHPSGKGFRCLGIVFNCNLGDDPMVMKLRSELDAALIAVVPKVYPISMDGEQYG
jgi:hypothetical protein